MDKNQFEQLKKLVMDLDKSLTRLKSFIDQNENEPGFDSLNDNFGFPPLPSRRPSPFSSNPNPNPSHSTRPTSFDDVLKEPLRRPEPVARANSTPSMPVVPQMPINIAPPVAKEDFNTMTALSPKPISPAPTTNTVLSPSDSGAITDEVEGTFDGLYLVSSTGQKLEVPASYSSKSRILFGDVIKAYKENGEQKFKVTTKQPRKKIKALTTKREGKWFVVSGLGSYKIADTAAEFNNLQLNQEVNVLIPENNSMVPYAAFDEVATVEQQKPAQAATNSSQPKPQQTQQPQNQQPQNQQPKNPAPAQSRPAPRNDNRNDRNFKPGPTPQPQQATPIAPSAPVDPALKVVEDFDLV